MVVHTFNPSTWEAETGGSEFETSLVYRNLPASASQVLRLKACTTTARHEYLFKINLYVCMYEYSACTPACQKRSSDHIDGCKQPCGCWELNTGSLEEQSMLLTAEPSL